MVVLSLMIKLESQVHIKKTSTLITNIGIDVSEFILDTGLKKLNQIHMTGEV